MNKDTLTLTIDKLAGLGDGQGVHNGRKLFVPYAMGGDVAQVTIARRTTDADYATLAEVITPSPDRIAPVCRHYGACGGCALQHVAAPVYKAFKEDMARAAVRKAGYDVGCVQPVVTFPAASRRRVDLHVKDGKLGYFAERSHSITDISECAVLEPALEALLLCLKPHLVAFPSLRSVHINGVDGGYDVLLEGEGISQWKVEHPALLRVSARFGGEVKTLYQAAEVTITLGQVKVKPPAGAFLQAVRGAQEAITALVMQATSDAASVLDLFAGLGTYSFPLASQAAVTAMEGEAAMVDALRAVAHKVQLPHPLTVRRRDLFRDPVPPRELARFDAVVINPPRSGAAAQCKALAEVRVPSLVMVSCNPATFARDARTLKEGGYQLQRITPIDQFSYSAHLEVVAEFFS